MSLTSALNTAQSIFNNSGTQSGVVSANISNASNPDYVRRQAIVTTSLDGSQVVKTARAQEDALFRQLLTNNSKDAAQQRLLSGLEDIKSTLGGNDYETAPATYLSAFHDSLQTFAGSPSSNTAAQSAITAAQDVANSLNTSSTAVQKIRADADKEIGTNVDTLNSLLAKFETANNAVKTATAAGGDPNDALDQRDSLLKQISKIVGVTTVTRDNNDVAIYTSEGTALFDTIPRKVTFQATNAFTAATKGNGVYIDGVAVTSGDGANTTAKGTLQALLQIRDDVAPTYQTQLDEIARGLVTMFSETNSTDSTDVKPGLFMSADGTTPATGVVVDGLASAIKVNPAVITSQGGNPMLLRDGGINGTDFVTNTTGGSGFSAQLDSYVVAMKTDMSFDSSTGVDTSSNILDFASNSIGWVEENRSGASSAAENTSASSSRSTEAYSNESGVNLDEELSLLLEIEQSYKAGTKILNAVDEMLKALMDIAS